MNMLKFDITCQNLAVMMVGLFPRRWRVYVLPLALLALVGTMVTVYVVNYNQVYSHHRRTTVSTVRTTMLGRENVNHIQPEANIVHCAAGVLYGSANASIEKFVPNIFIKEDPLVSWIETKRQSKFCDGKMVIFDNRFGLLHDVVMIASRRMNAEHKSRGGEEVRHVLNQGLEREEYSFRKGFWEMRCNQSNAVSGTSNYRHFQETEFLFEQYSIEALRKKFIGIETVRKFTLAVTREDYANLHNFARNIYNAFLIMLVFKLKPEDISVLILDGHPYCELDDAWETVFGPLNRVGHMEDTIFYRNLLWPIPEAQGPLTDFNRDTIPYTEEFRKFFLNQHNLSDATPLQCHSQMITVILRRNKVYHPRNIEGRVGRKIFNEAELIGGIMKAFPSACVQTVIMESLPMSAQLNIVRNTDIFIGMHGAGMTHTLFLPQHAGVLEIFPKDFKMGRPWYLCYEKIAKWRGLHYESWENSDPSREMPHDYSILPVDILVQKIEKLIRKQCKLPSRRRRRRKHRG